MIFKTASGLVFAVQFIFLGAYTGVVMNVIGSIRNIVFARLVSKNKSNNEVWSYNKMSTVNKQGGTDFLFGARASQSSSAQSFDLIITFDSNDIVLDYSVVSTSY